MIRTLQRFGTGIAKRWCRVMHPDPMWPVRGMYRCPRCQRTFPVPWEEKHSTAHAAPQPTLIEAMRKAPERVHAS